ncbi:MAG TPA: hypothetical protein VF133_07650 [Terriglobales bacterium]
MHLPKLHPISLFLVVIVSCSLLAQNPQLHVPRSRRFPTVFFTSVLWSADPAYYSIALDSSGTATYESLPASVGRNGVPYTMEFQVSDRTRRIAFNLAQGLNYFSGMQNQAIPSPQTTRVHTLAYIDTTFNNQFSYGTSSNADLEELTSVFEEVSETFENGRRLVYLQQHDKNALGPELQRLDHETQHRRTREFQALTPILRGLVQDQSLGGDVRREAAKLLTLAEGLH